MKTIYLHIGSPKTGTTSVQDCLSRNVNTLLNDFGVLYPSSGRNVIAHHPLVADLRTEFNGDKVPDHCYGSNLRGGNWQRLLSEIESYGDAVSKVVVSSEDFFTLFRRGDIAAIQSLKKVLSNFRVVVVVYLRRQDLFVDSLFNQEVKASLSRGRISTDLLTKHPATKKNYFQVLSAWAEVFGSENIILRPFAKEQFPSGDLVCDFLSQIGLDGVELPHASGVINERLSAQELIFKQQLNNQYEDNELCIKVFEGIRDLCPQSVVSNELLLLKADYLTIVDASAEVNRDLAVAFWGGENLFKPFPDSGDVRFLDVGSVDMSAYVTQLCANARSLDLSSQDLLKVESALLSVSREYLVDGTTVREMMAAFRVRPKVIFMAKLRYFMRRFKRRALTFLKYTKY